jgi:cytochrome P450
MTPMGTMGMKRQLISMRKTCNYPTTRNHSLDKLSVVATALVLLIAGYDTTDITLAFLAYEMSKNPEVQKKL